jgi:hypothetical protein
MSFQTLTLDNISQNYKKKLLMFPNHENTLKKKKKKTKTKKRKEKEIHKNQW